MGSSMVGDKVPDHDTMIFDPLPGGGGEPGRTRVRRWALFAILPIILVLCSSIWVMQRYVPRVLMESEDGVYDLTGVDLRHTMAELRRTVEYIPGELLTPEEFDARDDIQVGKLPDGTRVATMRAYILVPEDIQYGVCGYAANFANRIYINGKWLHDEGTLGLRPEEERAMETYHFFTAQPEDGVIEIVIQTTSFSHKDTSSGIQFNIGEYELIRAHYLRGLSATVMVMAWYVLMALVFLSLFIVAPQYKGNGWLALMALTWGLRTGVMGNKPLMVLVSGLDWTTGYHIEKASAPIALIFLMMALHASFPGALPRWLRRTVACVSAALAAAALLLPTRVYSNYSGDLMKAVSLMVLVLVAFLLLSLRRKKPGQPQIIILAGMGLYAAAYGWDMIYYYAGFTWPVIPLLPAMVLVFSLFLLEAAMLHTMQEMAKAHARERRAEAEKELLTELDRHKTAFYADVSHEMKNPLTLIAVNAELAAQTAADPEAASDLSAISAEAKRLAQMVTALVKMNCLQAEGAERAPLALDALAGEVGRMYQSLLSRKGNTLEIQVEPGLPPVRGDAEQIGQVLINLLSNANRHTKNGAVSIRAEAVPGAVRVTVADTGEGVDPALLPHVFERYARGHSEGTGLGLYICKGIVEAHGGEMGMESQPGKGARVWFTLPAEESEEEKHE